MILFLILILKRRLKFLGRPGIGGHLPDRMVQQKRFLIDPSIRYQLRNTWSSNRRSTCAAGRLRGSGRLNRETAQHPRHSSLQDRSSDNTWQICKWLRALLVCMFEAWLRARQPRLAVTDFPDAKIAQPSTSTTSSPRVTLLLLKLAPLVRVLVRVT